MEPKKLKTVEHYEAAAHAMQSGVAAMMEIDDTSTQPKHLRVGVNSAAVDASALATLLIEKGVFTREEYIDALARQMEAEAKTYRDLLSEKLGGVNVVLI